MLLSFSLASNPAGYQHALATAPHIR